ncbi:MAG: hypothetical protein BWY74_03384 [Firmicutes bacterium ADurb.Bin419]|nr:MAG: hypothetical protein BWY74_03384 [Firmicutes bacterium ADurb.Bin419]
MSKLLVKRHFGNINRICVFMATLSVVALFELPVRALSPENEEEIRKKLSDILASGEFGEKIKSKSLLEILYEKFMDFIKSIWKKFDIGNKFEGVLENAKVSEETLFFLKILSIVLMLAVILLVIYFVARRFTRPRKLRQKEDALLLDVLKDPDDVYKKACECCDNGDYTQGLRFLYISLLIRFNEQNIIRINKAKTNKQYLNEIRNNKPDLYDFMNDFTQVFNRHWYGGKNADKSTFDNWNNIYNNLYALKE